MIRKRKSRDEWLSPYGLDCSQGPTIPTQTSGNALARSTVTQTKRREWSLMRKENLTSTDQYADFRKSGKQATQEKGYRKAVASSGQPCVICGRALAAPAPLASIALRRATHGRSRFLADPLGDSGRLARSHVDGKSVSSKTSGLASCRRD